MPPAALKKNNHSVVDIKKKQYIGDILSEVYSSGPLTISQLAKTLHTSVPSITGLINELMSENWILEVGSSKTKSGRRPSLFDLNPNKNTTIVLDINLYNTTIVLINLRNEILKTDILDLEIGDPEFPEKLSAGLFTFLEKSLKPWAVGISVSGLVGGTDGVNYTYDNHNKNGLSLANFIQQQIKVPTFMLHDTKASMIGEHHFGLAKGKKNVLLINLNWGVGLGILSNGEIIQGADGFAGELGHIQVNPNGELCNCGKIGCLETVASASALIKKAKKELKAGKISSLSKMNGDISLEQIIDAAIKGDEFSIDLIFDIGRELGKGLSIAIHLFNPQIIIIDGIMTNAGDLIISTLQQAINKYCLKDFKKNIEILISPIGEKAKIYGVKSYVFHKMLQKQSI
jgi:N-acetylglucosamine repressor